MEKAVEPGWLHVSTAPAKEVVYVGTEKMQVLAYKDDVGQWRKKVNHKPLNWRVWQWKPRKNG